MAALRARAWRRCFCTRPAAPFDVVVIGGGHAGCEAAAAACRVGASTLLITQRLDTIGVMSCNPAIGGVGKGTLVREVDALGGLMGRAADDAGIQFRMLNRSKGEAVWGPRCQADRVLYRDAVQSLLGSELGARGLQTREAGVEDLRLEEATGGGPPRLVGVRLADGSLVATRTVVITTGTFLRGRLLCGRSTADGGRIGERPAVGIARTFERLGVDLGRLKTGTPPRLDGRTVDFSRLAPQDGDADPAPFSFLNADEGPRMARSQLSCFVTYTNARTHDIVRNAQHLAPPHEGAEPRYCPSIDSKVKRFASKQSHQVWLEPEGLPEHTHLVYPNGISTALPPEVQEQLVRSMVGLERADVVQCGYAVEYDYVLPTQLERTLALRKVRGVFLAGQINGTTGYEEAAAQGVIAGANAALEALGRPSLTLDRDEALAGVLVDDLVTRGVSEPYRMFTSRAENRLSLRADNADLRLTERAARAGLLCERADAGRLERARRRADALAEAEAALRAIRLTPGEWATLGVEVKRSGGRRTAWGVLGLAHQDGPALLARLRDDERAVPTLAPDVLHQLVVRARYDPYIKHAQAHISDFRAVGHRLPLREDTDYAALRELSDEERARLAAVRPATVAEAALLEGITATGVEVLLREAKRGVVEAATRDVSADGGR